MSLNGKSHVPFAHIDNDAQGTIIWSGAKINCGTDCIHYAFFADVDIDF